MNYHTAIQSKIFSDFNEFSNLLDSWKGNYEKIVFTNGCFDLVHPGHIESLALSAEKGSKLIVGLNTDKSVAGLKGAGRPLINQQSRAYILASPGFC